MKRARSKLKKSAQNRLPEATKPAKIPFIEHLYELRKRLFYVALSVGIFSVAAYGVQQKIVALLLRPAKGQQFIYTTPGGGLDFLFRVCVYTGIAFSIPVIVHQILRYLEPLIKKDATRFIRIGNIASIILALIGMAFGYFLGLPAALHFLLHQFTTSQIQALLSIQSYISFVTIYMLASAFLFQIPLILLLINRIKPLKPRKLLGYERWVIVSAVIIGGMVNPSPNIFDQMMLAGPMILTYQIGILLVWRANRRHRRPKRALELLQKDLEVRAARLQEFAQARDNWRRMASQINNTTNQYQTTRPNRNLSPRQRTYAQALTSERRFGAKPIDIARQPALQ